MEYGANLDFRIWRLFLAKTSLHKVLKLNYEVFLIDCTYKTNAYRMPLCIITGITPLNTTYYAGFLFYPWKLLRIMSGCFDALKTYILSLIFPTRMLSILPQVKLLNEKELKGKALEPYAGSFTCSLGLPCVHTIERRNLANGPLKLEDVN